jgi:hypothetical protein
MRTSSLLLGALFLVGCSREVNKKLDAIADRACTCADAECVKKIKGDLEVLAKEHQGKLGDKEAAQKSINRIRSCLMKVPGVTGAQAVDGMKANEERDGKDDKIDERPADRAEEKPAEK